MGLFSQLCRNTGLMIHHIIRPVRTQTHELNRTVEEKQVNATTIVRRTTIEEIEVRHEDADR